MVKTLTFVVGLLAAVGGASVIASTRAPREAPVALASVPLPAAPQPVAEEARWTLTPVVVASTQAYTRIAGVEAPRDINTPAPSAEPAAAPIPTPLPRPPSTEWLVDGDRAFLAQWCRSERQARQMCRMMREPRRQAREPREARWRGSRGNYRPVVHIRRGDRYRSYAAPRYEAPHTAAFWRPFLPFFR